MTQQILSGEDLRVSVVIPTYNMSAYVPKAIESALAQTMAPCEVIVVDDGSTDDTERVVAEFGDRVIYLKQPLNRGVSAARNAGAARATGNWLLFLDSDDKLLPSALARLSQCARGDPAGVVFGWTEQSNEDTGERSVRGKGTCAGEPPHPAKQNFLRALIPTPGAAIVRRELHDRVGGFEKPWQPTEDRDYWIKCGVLAAFKFCDAQVLEKLRRKASSRVYSDIAVFWGMRVQLEFLDWCRGRGIDTSFLQTSPSEIAERSLALAIDRRDWGVAETILEYARRLAIDIPFGVRARFHALRALGGRRAPMQAERIKLFVSIKPARRGGGSNTFANNVGVWARRQGLRLEDTLEESEVAIVIAHCGATFEGLQKARDRGCFIIHRVDEHLGGLTDESHVRKHEMIRQLNKAAHVTVYQSEFVRRTAQPFLQAKRHVVILNGADPTVFHPAREPGLDIGHVTWGTIRKKRLDLVCEEIKRRPGESFRLVGRHAQAEDPVLNFHLPNVELCGERNRRQMTAEYRKMKVLFFPSENDPCPNTVIEAILCGVPVCYHESGGTPDIVKDCGVPLERFDELLRSQEVFRQRCLRRSDLFFDAVMGKYNALWKDRGS